MATGLHVDELAFGLILLSLVVVLMRVVIRIVLGLSFFFVVSFNWLFSAIIV